MLSFVCSSVVLALMLAPLVLYRLYLYAISDIGAEPNPFPEPWWALFWGSVIAFVLSMFVAVPVVSLFRACLENPARRRVTRGLQKTPEIRIPCRPGALTGRISKHALSVGVRRAAGSRLLALPCSP